MKFYNFYKRLIDIFFSIFIGLFFSPLLLIIIPFYLLFVGRPILFTQYRLGKYQNKFLIYKFRTLKIKNSLNDSDLIFLGSFLRKSGIDEIPSLFNIFKGDMSFVGPRPLLTEYKEIYSEEENKRHNVLPGLTGLAQIKGRNSLSWKNKFRYDNFYIKKKSIKLDFYIIYKTVLYFIKLKGFKKNEVKFIKKYEK